MLQPKKTKFRREQKGRMKGNAQRGNQLAFGSFGLKTLENCWLTAQQIEAARQAISRRMNREGQIWIRVFPVKPVTKKPLSTRMGKGKGDPYGFVAPITPGRILFEAWRPTSSPSTRSSSSAGTMSNNLMEKENESFRSTRNVHRRSA